MVLNNIKFVGTYKNVLNGYIVNIRCGVNNGVTYYYYIKNGNRIIIGNRISKKLFIKIKNSSTKLLISETKSLIKCDNILYNSRDISSNCCIGGSMKSKILVMGNPNICNGCKYSNITQKNTKKQLV
jgi:hypothetical protein